MRFIGDLFLYTVVGVVYWWWTANFSVFGISPNIVFAAALSSAILARPAKAMTYCFFFGIYLDLIGSNLFGAYALAYTLMAYAIYIMKRHFDLVGGFSQIVAALTMSVLTMLFYQGMSLALAKINPLQLKAFFVEPVLNAVLMPFVFYFFALFKRRFDIV